jgi:hypothetical protein
LEPGFAEFSFITGNRVDRIVLQCPKSGAFMFKKNPDELVEKALKLADKGDLPGAIKLIDQALKSTPSLPICGN